MVQRVIGDRVIRVQVILILMLLVFVGPVRGWIGATEGTLFPVVSPLRVEVAGYDPRGTVVAGNADKLRDCQYRHAVFFYGVPGNSVPIRGGFDDPPAITSVGVRDWSGVWFGVEPTQVTDTFVEVYHQCPGRWYETKTTWRLE